MLEISMVCTILGLSTLSTFAKSTFAKVLENSMLWAIIHGNVIIVLLLLL